jgi:hypothetical protein
MFRLLHSWLLLRHAIAVHVRSHGSIIVAPQCRVRRRLTALVLNISSGEFRWAKCGIPRYILACAGGLAESTALEAGRRMPRTTTAS